MGDNRLQKLYSLCRRRARHHFLRSFGTNCQAKQAGTTVPDGC